MTNLERPVLQVELNDGSTHVVTILNPSLVAWDRTRATRKWPNVEDAPLLWMTFITWHHLHATGVVSCTFEEYETGVCEAVGDPRRDGAPVGEEVPVEVVDPTHLAAVPASATS